MDLRLLLFMNREKMCRILFPPLIFFFYEVKHLFKIKVMNCSHHVTF